MTGTLNIMDLAVRIPPVMHTRTIQAGVGLYDGRHRAQAGAVPDASVAAETPTPMRPRPCRPSWPRRRPKVAIYILIRVYFTIFGKADIFDEFPIRDLLLILALVAMFAGSLVAVWQNNVKRLLAYSSVAQIGYMVLGISLATEAGPDRRNPAPVQPRPDEVRPVPCGGLRVPAGRRRRHQEPSRVWASACRGPWRAFVLAGLSLIGVPLTVGFVSKWYLVKAVMELGWWPIAVLILLSSLLAVIYVWRVVEAAYMKPAPEGAPEIKEAPAFDADSNLCDDGRGALFRH